MKCFSPLHVNGYTVPCGKCAACLQKKQRDWIFRLKQELRYFPYAFFLTLTYNSDTVPFVVTEVSKGCIYGTNTFDKSDVQKFLKRFRKKLKNVPLRYFIVSEYGGESHRPHYHGVLFFDRFIDYHYLYKAIDASWSLGFTCLRLVTASHLAYVCKYTYSPELLDGVQFRKKPYRTFLLASKRNSSGFGIGSGFVTEARCRYYKATLDTSVVDNGHRVAMPRYYRTKFFDADERAIILEKYLDEEYKNVLKFYEEIGKAIDKSDSRLYQRLVSQETLRRDNFLRKFYKNSKHK